VGFEEVIVDEMLADLYEYGEVFIGNYVWFE
jgi:hypothetical protein